MNTLEKLHHEMKKCHDNEIYKTMKTIEISSSFSATFNGDYHSCDAILKVRNHGKYLESFLEINDGENRSEITLCDTDSEDQIYPNLRKLYKFLPDPVRINANHINHVIVDAISRVKQVRENYEIKFAAFSACFE